MQSETTLRERALVFAAFAYPVIILLGVFCLSVVMGGQIWDEQLDHAGTVQQLDVVGRLLGGDTTASFRQVQENFAFYGIVAVLPAYLIETAAGYLGYADPSAVFSVSLHTTAFLCNLLTLLATYLLLLRATGSRAAAMIGAGLLALYPLWLGWSFFDHKDIPTAAFDMLALYAAVGILQSADNRRDLLRFTALLALATILLGGLKLPAIVLVVPQWLAALVVHVRGRHYKLALVLVLATIAGLVLAIPVSWTDPLNYVLESFALMSRHNWAGCTLSAGTWMCTHQPEWSSLGYLATWYVAQVPLLIGVGALLGIVLAPWRGPVQILIASSLAVPLFLIVVRNSTLYDGLRHVLFTIPIIFSLATMFWYEIARKTSSNAVLTAASVLGGLFVWDNIAMFPLNYVYFNLPTRMLADDTNFVTDIWGFSLKEASRLPIADQPTPVLVGNPLHVVTPYLKRPIMLWPGNVGSLGKPTPLVMVAYVREQQVPPWCTDVQFVTRKLPFGRPIKMSFAAKCTWQ